MARASEGAIDALTLYQMPVSTFYEAEVVVDTINDPEIKEWFKVQWETQQRHRQLRQKKPG